MKDVRVGQRVLVPRHGKPRGGERTWDRGTVVSVNEYRIVEVNMDAFERPSYVPVGLLHPVDNISVQNRNLSQEWSAATTREP